MRTAGLQRLLRAIPRRERSARERRQRRALLLAAAALAALVALPVAEPLGGAVASLRCPPSGCSAGAVEIPQCSGFGRDRAALADALTFSATAGENRRFRIVGRADGTVTVFEAAHASEAEAAGYRFADYAQAQDWMRERGTAVDRVVDAGVSPLGGGAYGAYGRALEGLGFAAAEARAPTWTVRAVSGAGARGRIVENEDAQSARQVMTVEGGTGTAIARVLPRLGIAPPAVVTVHSGADGQATELDIEGRSREGWNLDALRGGEAPSEAETAAAPPASDQFTWRTYRLDLRLAANARAFSRAFARAADAGATAYAPAADASSSGAPRPAEGLGERVAANAVYLESHFEPGATSEPATAPEAIVAGIGASLGQTADARVTAIAAADLGVPAARLRPVLECGDEGGQ